MPRGAATRLSAPGVGGDAHWEAGTGRGARTWSSGAESRSLRDTLARYATGVAVVTTVGLDGCPVGLTVNSFTSVSLDPPLVLWCLRRASTCVPAFSSSDGYAVNVLAAGQQELARRFATAHAERFHGVGWRPGRGGVPVLVGTAAHLICRTEQRQVMGDHLVLVGRVLEHGARNGPTLLFHGGRLVVPATPQP